MPVYDFDNLTNTAVAPSMVDNEALRRILYVLNFALSSAGGMVTVSSETEGAPVTGFPMTAGKDDLGNAQYLSTDTLGRLNINLIASDIQIGAVELKDALTSARAVITAGGELTVTDPQALTLLTAIDASLTLIEQNTDGIETLLGTTNTNTGNTATSTANVDTNLGAKADAAAGTDTATASLIALQKRLLQHLSTVITSLGSLATEATLSAINTKTPALVSGRVPVDGSGVTQPVSAASLPLPTGAATEATLSTVATNTSVSKNAGATDATTQRVVVANDQTIPVSASSLPLPTGAASESTLSALNTKVPSQGAALIAASIPVNIASNQTVPISAVSLPLPTNAATDLSITNLNADLGDTADAVAASDSANASLIAFAKRIATNITTLTTAVGVTSSGNAAQLTNATGSTYQALSSQACARVHIYNFSGVDIEIQQGGSGTAQPLLADTGITFSGVTNANQLAIRRVDLSNTQVTVNYRWEA